MLNRLLGGHYHVVQHLGEGGLAKTYIAEDHHRPGHPLCAVKYLKPATNVPNFLPIARRLFNQEAEVLEKIGQHDQIPRLLAYFEENREFYLVQEFIKGHTLNLELIPGERWSENKVIEMLKDVLAILKFVHSYGVIHRDINPNNIIRRQQDERLVLIDFGAVKQVRNPQMMTQEETSIQKTISIGTKGYLPPEQLRGKPRLNSDIYALGMIAIQALTGRNPLYLEEDSDGEVIWQNLTKVSDDLVLILNKMVCYRFQERYQSTTEVLEALQTLRLKNYSVPIQPTPYPQPTSPEVSFETDLSDLKTTREFGQTMAQVTQHQEQEYQKEEYQPEQIDLVNSKGLLESSAGLQLSHTSILVNLHKYRWFMGAGFVSIFISLFAGYTYMTHKLHYLEAQETLEQIEALKTEAKYQECVQQAQIFPSDYSDLYGKAQTFLNQCQQSQAKAQLARAKSLAEQSRFKDAIMLADQIRSNTSAHTAAQQLIYDWSEKILQIASNKYQEGNLPEAMTIAAAVPTNSPLAQKVQVTVQQWNEEWQQNQIHLQAAQKAMDESRWQDAIKVAEKINNTDYWQKQSELIIKKAEAEIASAQAAAAQKTYNNTYSRSVGSSRSSRSRYSGRSRSRTSRRASRSPARSSGSNSLVVLRSLRSGSDETSGLADGGYEVG